MRRVLLDTNVYGHIIKTTDKDCLIERVKNHTMLICGSSIIRQELRDIPKNAMYKDIGVRNLCLEIYDGLVDEKRNYAVTELVRSIAMEYSRIYKGFHSWRELENDFLIVASSSLHNIDIVVSNDERTMISQIAMDAYRIVNRKFQLRSPNFINHGKFLDLLK